MAYDISEDDYLPGGVTVTPVSVPDPITVTPILPEIATGSMATGPKDEVSAPDIYAIGKDVAKSFTSVKSIGLEAQSKLEGFFNNPTELADFLLKGKDKLGLEFDESILTKRLAETSSELRGAFTDLTTDMKESSIISMAKDKYNKLSCTVGDVKSMVSASKVKDIKGLGNFVNKYTNSKIFNSNDSGALSSVMASVVAKTQELGIAGAYTSLMSTIQDSTILRLMTKTLVPIALAKNYPTLLRELSSGPYGKVLNYIAPGMSQSLVKNFTMKSGMTNRSINSFEDMLGAIDGTYGAWSIGKRGDNDMFDLVNIMGGSRDFQRLLASGVQYFYSSQQGANSGTKITTPTGAQVYAIYGIAAYFSPTTAAASVKRFFPKVAMTGTYETTIPTTRSTSRSRVSSNQTSITDARLINHIANSFFN